jgi:hypothetical protein
MDAMEISSVTMFLNPTNDPVTSTKGTQIMEDINPTHMAVVGFPFTQPCLSFTNRQDLQNLLNCTQP